MPYINNFKRKKYENAIQEIVYLIKEEIEQDEDGKHNYVGDLNYIITNILVRSMPDKRYKYINDIMGVIAGVDREFYRRFASTYENKAIEKNGDIDVYKSE